MDVTPALLDRLADRLLDAPASVSLERVAGDRIRPFHQGARLEGMPGQDFLFGAPDGERAAIVELAAVAFSADGGRALTLYDLYCGPSLCAVGYYVLLERAGAGWKVVSTVLHWIS